MEIDLQAEYSLYLSNTKDNRPGAGPYTLTLPDEPAFRGTPAEVLAEVAEFQRISGGCLIRVRIVDGDGRECSRDDLQLAVSWAERDHATLTDFLASHSICRVWFTSTAHPTGCEFILDTVGEDYCDEGDLLGLEPVTQAIEGGFSGRVSDDGDGEIRWELDGSAGAVTDSRANTVLRLVVWGTKND